jgi:CBS domain containing-hemolysin-like protein
LYSFYLEIEEFFEKLGLHRSISDSISGVIWSLFGDIDSKPREIAYHHLSMCDDVLPNDNIPLHLHDQNIGTLKRRKK